MKKCNLLLLVAVFLSMAIFSSCGQKKTEGRNAVLVLGTKTMYWDKIAEGAKEEAAERGINLTVYNFEEETAYAETGRYVASLASDPNLIGVACIDIDQAIDDGFAELPEDLPVIAIEGEYIPGGAVEQRLRGTVALNYEEYMNAFADVIPEEKVAILAYSQGANKFLTDVLVERKGADNVFIGATNDSATGNDLLRELLAAHPETEAVILCSSNFINDEVFGISGDLPVYTSDMDIAAAYALRDGRALKGIAINTYAFGANMVKAIDEADKNPGEVFDYDIPFVFIDKDNINTSEIRQLFY